MWPNMPYGIHNIIIKDVPCSANLSNDIPTFHNDSISSSALYFVIYDHPRSKVIVKVYKENDRLPVHFC